VPGTVLKEQEVTDFGVVLCICNSLCYRLHLLSRVCPINVKIGVNAWLSTV